MNNYVNSQNVCHIVCSLSEIIPTSLGVIVLATSSPNQLELTLNDISPFKLRTMLWTC